MGVRKSFYQAAVFILKIFLLFIGAYLVYTGIRYSYYSAKSYDLRIYEVPDSTILHVLAFGIACLASTIFLFLWHRLCNRFDQEKMCGIVLLAACVWLLVIGILYLRSHPYYPQGDQLNVAAGAAYARAGDYDMFGKGGYIGLYEQQKGLVFLYEILFSLFGDFCFSIVGYLNLCFMIVTLIFGYYFLKHVAKKAFYRILYCVLMMFCVPYIIYLPYAYGDLPSICFSMILFWAIAVFKEDLKIRYVFIACIAAALALLVRTSSSIVLIAVAIGMVLLAMETISFRPILAALCILIVSWGSVKAVDRMYEMKSGFESGIGIPKILWVAMGLQETDGNPGIYNRYQQMVFEECGFERETATEVGKRYIMNRLKEFQDSPAYARYFFTGKIKLQWLEPLFEGLYATSTFDEDSEYPDWITDLYYGDSHDVIWNFANYYQSLIYLSFLCFIVSFFFRRSSVLFEVTGWIPLIAVVGGFLFCIMWESQCRYMLPYYIFIILYAAFGMGRIAESIYRGIIYIRERI